MHLMTQREFASSLGLLMQQNLAIADGLANTPVQANFFHNFLNNASNINSPLFFQSGHQQNDHNPIHPLASVLAASFNAPSQAPAISIPSKGINQQKLDDIAYDMDSKDLPQDYLCAISYEVMSDPVFDPQSPGIKFEKSWILKALSIKKENPCTRTPLQAKDLQSDLALKEKIDTFVKETVQAHKKGQEQHAAGFGLGL